MPSEEDNGGTAVYGLFLASSNRYNDPNAHWSNYYINHVYINNASWVSNVAGWTAHELYYHGYRYLIGKDWKHDANSIIRKTIEFNNAQKRGI